MTLLTLELRKEAGKYDLMLSDLFDYYIGEKNNKKKNELELEIENTLIQMSDNVNKKCYETYDEIYQSIKSMRT